MFRRLSTLLITISTLLSACSIPLAGTPTATLAPTTTAEPTNNPAPTNEQEPTARPDPTATTQPIAKPAPTEVPVPTKAPATQGLQPVSCSFSLPTGANATCYVLFVPENRASSNSRTIELAVAVFKSSGNNPAKDPVVYLEGGPGGNALQALEFTYEDNFVPMLADRDVIVFDQRGTGYSKPSLACDEYTKLAYDTLNKNISLEEGNKLFIAALLKCHDRLIATGVDLTAYNSVASAADIEDLRKALGYEQWNLYGSSYGTRLALTTMREYPAGIRSVVLDATRSLQASETSTPGDVDRSFEKLFSGCKQDVACNKAFPNLHDRFYALVDTLNKEPIVDQATNPFTQKQLNILINGDALIGLTAQAMYSSDLITQLPKAVFAASEGIDHSLFVRLALNSVLQNEYLSYGMFFAVRCNEEISFDTVEALAAADDAFPQQHQVFDLSTYTTICNTWQAGTAPTIENEPVISDIPTLVLAGEYDPATPPDDGREAAKTLTNSTFIEFPGRGHAPGFDGGCPQNIALAFLNDPTSKPDTSCVAEQSAPAFVGTGSDLVLKPLVNQQFGYSSLIPEAWEEISSGIYARNRTSDIAILQLGISFTKQQALDNLANQFGLEGDRSPSGTHKGASFTWDLYKLTLQGLPADLALAERDGKTYVILLISDNVERTLLYDGLFIPVLDAFAPVTVS